VIQTAKNIAAPQAVCQMFLPEILPNETTIHIRSRLLFSTQPALRDCSGNTHPETRSER
jgi:hypothetical protein